MEKDIESQPPSKALGRSGAEDPESNQSHLDGEQPVSQYQGMRNMLNSFTTSDGRAEKWKWIKNMATTGIEPVDSIEKKCLDEMRKRKDTTDQSKQKYAGDPFASPALKVQADSNSLKPEEHEQDDLHVQILSEMMDQAKAAEEEKPLDWFVDFSFLDKPIHRRRRELCLEKKKAPWFQSFYTFLIVCNAITLGLSANDSLSGVQAQAIESVFTALYIYELYVRYYGSDKKPWRDLPLMLDSILVGIAAVDLWGFGFAEVTMDVKRPNMSVVMVFRLLRLTRIAKAAEKFSSVARPLRIIQIMMKEGPILFGGIIGMFVIFSFFCSNVMYSVITLDTGQVPEENTLHFSSISKSIYTFVTILEGQVQWRSDVIPGLEVAGVLGPSIFRFCIFCLFFLKLLALAAICEQLNNSAAEDDKRQSYKKVGVEMNIDYVNEALRLIGDEHGCITAKDLNHAYNDYSELKHIFGMSGEDAETILQDTARQTIKGDEAIEEKRVKVQDFLVNLFKAKCARAQMAQLLDDERYRECQKWSLLASNSSKEDVLEPARHRQGTQKGPRLKIQQGSAHVGLTGEVENLLGNVTQTTAGMNVTYHDLGMAVANMETHLDRLLQSVGKADWVGMNDSSEGAIRIASMKFASELRRFAYCTENWINHSTQAHLNLADSDHEGADAEYHR